MPAKKARVRSSPKYPLGTEFTIPQAHVVCKVPRRRASLLLRRIRPVVGSSGMSDLPPRNAADQGFDWKLSSDERGSLDDSYFKRPKRIAIINLGALALDP